MKTGTLLKNFWPKDALSNIGGWKERHKDALTSARANTASGSFVALAKAWIEYGETYRLLNDRPIGNDSYAGQYFEEIGHALHQLLSMDIGNLDGGTMSAGLLDYAKSQKANIE